ncbi:MAG TPA: permease prefix domain 1-containing protein, partial [Gemmatimonadaceae bacterium]
MGDLKRIFHLGLRRAKNIGADIETEIAFHLQERVDALVARGWSEADAMAEAKRRFGDPEASRPVLFAAATQRERRLDWLERLDTLIADVKLSARQLRLAPTFAFGIIAAIALGIGANATMFGVIDRLMLRAPAGIGSPNQVYTFERAGRGDYSAAISYTDLGTLRSIVGHDARLAVESFRSSAAIEFGDETHAVSRIFVDDEYFQMLGVHAARGRLISSDDLEPTGSHAVAVISYEMWQRQFGG